MWAAVCRQLTYVKIASNNILILSISLIKLKNDLTFLYYFQIDEKLQTLTDIERKVKSAWAARCALITRTKAVIVFFNEAKQIQTSLATREVMENSGLLIS